MQISKTFIDSPAPQKTAWQILKTFALVEPLQIHNHIDDFGYNLQSSTNSNNTVYMEQKRNKVSLQFQFPDFQHSIQLFHNPFTTYRAVLLETNPKESYKHLLTKQLQRNAIVFQHSPVGFLDYPPQTPQLNYPNTNFACRLLSTKNILDTLHIKEVCCFVPRSSRLFFEWALQNYSKKFYAPHKQEEKTFFIQNKNELLCPRQSIQRAKQKLKSL